MRTLAIGDIHGCYTALKTLINSVNITPEDTIVTLGDYIDRGSDSKQVIDYLLELQQSHHLITLKGNHEVMMENARDSRQELEFWLINGGDATLASFHTLNLQHIPQSYWDFIKSCQLYHETSHHILVHAGLEPETPLDKQPDDYLLWHRIHDTHQHISGKTIVCGHTPQKNGTPLKLDHAICIDTHACDGKWLTCLDIESGNYWQANQNKETRTGKI